jgi:hypothetical protein
MDSGSHARDVPKPNTWNMLLAGLGTVGAAGLMRLRA